MRQAILNNAPLYKIFCLENIYFIYFRVDFFIKIINYVKQFNSIHSIFFPRKLTYNIGYFQSFFRRSWVAHQCVYPCTRTHILGTRQFDLFCTSSSLLRSIVKSILVEVKSVGRRYENGRSTEKVELMRTPYFSCRRFLTPLNDVICIPAVILVTRCTVQ